MVADPTVGWSLGQVWAAQRIETQFLSTRVTQPGKENGLRHNDNDGISERLRKERCGNRGQNHFFNLV